MNQLCKEPIDIVSLYQLLHSVSIFLAKYRAEGFLKTFGQYSGIHAHVFMELSCKISLFQVNPKHFSKKYFFCHPNANLVLLLVIKRAVSEIMPVLEVCVPTGQTLYR